ncbi:aminopeptidase P family protein [Breoghania sp. L-A4]|uniref:aminopeptidase P family protein n=1 Tax=Breoghania sp. L-A4 TaxID=2304600 RepID=UPI000E35CE2D|nr:aminopeptidase P family protein [Breoghania sp. L-A4]AXS41318.1 aminopeptidase P family protein [Breoghania sp. L-A4]
MFQTFDDIADPTRGTERLALLRKELSQRGLDGFLVPRADAHQGEYVAACDERLAWLTGFGGSAGTAAVLGDRAAIFVDGRYTLQVRDQVDCEAFEPQHLIDNPPSKWLAGILQPGQKLGYDPMLHTISGVKRLREVCEAAGAELVAETDNPVDAIWRDRPQPPIGPVTLHPIEFSGEAASDKIARLQEILRAQKADSAVLTQPESIAWAFNIRGCDVPHTPLPLSFAILHAESAPELFIDGRKLSNAVRAELDEIVRVEAPEAFFVRLGAMDGQAVLADPAMTAEAIGRIVETAGGRIVKGSDPVALPRARKNAVEIAGARAAHLRDGAAFARFLAWFDAHAPAGDLDEIIAARALEGFRQETGKLREISFDTISGAGPNGAIVHYRVSHETNRAIEPDSLYLVDSGAQYEDGTTDITRTLVVGEPTADMRRHYTLVLKGHIGIATARFPVGASGAQLDTLARIALWKAGLDFDHGTGHGVGSYLSVHEGPQRISKLGTVPLEPGMILSNEPGYYRTGAYGIRIENLECVTGPSEIAGGERPMLGFETLTLAPFERRLIDVALLDEAERAWVDAYHARVRAEVGAELDMETRGWLNAATDPLTP